MLSAATLLASVAALGVGMALHRREEWMEVLTAVAAAALSALSATSGPSPTPTPTTNPSPSPSPLQSLRSLGFDPAGYAPSDLTGAMCFLLYTNGDESKLSCIARFVFYFYNFVSMTTLRM